MLAFVRLTVCPSCSVYAMHMERGVVAQAPWTTVERVLWTTEHVHDPEHATSCPSGCWVFFAQVAPCGSVPLPVRASSSIVLCPQLSVSLFITPGLSMLRTWSWEA